MHSVSQLNTDTKLMRLPSAVTMLSIFAAVAAAQLPAGPGKAETEKLCVQCHELERSISPRQDRAGWQATIDKMSGSVS